MAAGVSVEGEDVLLFVALLHEGTLHLTIGLFDAFELFLKSSRAADLIPYVNSEQPPAVLSSEENIWQFQTPCFTSQGNQLIIQIFI